MSRKISKGKTKTTAAKETIYTVPTHQTALWTLLYVRLDESPTLHC